MNANRPILPGATLGVVGGGQLGRMFTCAAQRLGYRVHVFAPEPDPPAAHVANAHVRAAYDDIPAVTAFARSVAAITYEFENIPADMLFVAEKYAPVRPGVHVLQTAQNRLRERAGLVDAGLAVSPFHAVHDEPALAAAVRALGTPVVLKTAETGYDGKGQIRIDDEADAPTAWKAIGGVPAICEAWVQFEAELSVVIARGFDGAVATYGPLRNTHHRHILDTTVFPAGVTPRIEANAITLAKRVATALDVVGVLCIEMFLLPDGRLLINELAPRPHNSGHLTLDAHATCQFEQQVRTLCGLPLGDARPRSAAAMINLLGDLWSSGPPAFDRLLARPDVRLHLYGKRTARAGRKMGHLTALAETPEAARATAESARRALSEQPALQPT